MSWQKAFPLPITTPVNQITGFDWSSLQQDDPNTKDLEEKIREAQSKSGAEVKKCPKGHETGVKEIGSGKYYCCLCGKTWTQ